MRIAVIGSGISGLTAAYKLSQEFEVHLFEKDGRLGGHTATKQVQVDGQNYAIDTGFIVFNDRTYPRFEALMEEVGVKSQPTDMSFSVHNQDTGLEYNGHNLSTLFAQKRNILNPRFLGMIREILRFNKRCKEIYADNDAKNTQTLGEFLQENRFSTYFQHNYILPMGAAIWSSTLGEMLSFPLRFFVQFFENHGLLNVQDRPQWYTLVGGSHQYIPHLIRPLGSENVHLNAQIRMVTRDAAGVNLQFADGQTMRFDQVIFATHSDQALALLGDSTLEERSVLSAIPYRANDVVLHTDTRLLPKSKQAWAAWNYRLCNQMDQSAAVTYCMNILQRLPKDAPTFCVTLNQTDDIDPSKILGRYEYHHPTFSVDMVAAQRKRDLISGFGNTHFCGAYWYNGFHEDGVRSALDVVADIRSLQRRKAA
ncbi:MAG: FAD-dependent oxidoreductase [Gammaproteobacteria bacterium]|nr:FAD-dependent oxidoreductase [Gammaproteobacteria bacterium]